MPSVSFVSEAEWFYYLMDTVDLGEEPPLDIVPLKENNPLKSPQDSYLLTFKILWLRAYPSHTVGHKSARGLEPLVSAMLGRFQLRAESIKGTSTLGSS